MELTAEQLLGIFSDYNAQIWPMQIAAYLIGIAGLWLVIRKSRFYARLIPAILAFFWLWVSLMFWLPSALQGFPPAYLFAAIFLAQGALFLLQTFRPKLIFGYQPNLVSWAGIFFVFYAMVGYPLFGLVIGHAYPHSPPFGLTPCPLIVYTIGLLLLTTQKVPKSLLIIPFLYALSGFLWVAIGITEDIGMILSGLLGAALIWQRDYKAVTATEPRSSPDSSERGWSLDMADKD
jgi:hypothetical protein